MNPESFSFRALSATSCRRPLLYPDMKSGRKVIEVLQARRACFLFECPPSLVAGLRRLRGRSTMRRPSPRRRSSSCCSCSPPTRRPSRRRVASVSSQSNRNRTRRPQGLVQLRRRPRHAGSLMQLRVVQSGRTVLRDAVLRVARSIMRSSSCGSTAPLSLSCTSVVYGGGAGCAPIWPTSSLSRAARFMRARALCPCSLRLLWGRLARSERTDLHHLPPLLWLRGPPVPAVMRCMGVSTVPSARLCCSDRASPGSSRARRRPRRPTQVACDARATAPVPAEES